MEGGRAEATLAAQYPDERRQWSENRRSIPSLAMKYEIGEIPFPGVPLG
jgi:hypothetical protein